MISSDLFKFSIGLIGMATAILILVWGLIKKDNKKIRRAAAVFIITWIVLLLFALVELLRVI